MLCAKTKVKHILDVKNQWQKTFGLRKVANMFQSFFSHFPFWHFFHYPHPLLFKYILVLLTPSNSFVPHPSLLSKSTISPCSLFILLNLEYPSQLQIVSKQLAMFKLNQVPKYHDKGAHVQHFLPFSTNFQIIMLMLRLEVGEGER